MKPQNFLLLGLLGAGAYYFLDKSKQGRFNAGVRVQITGVRIEAAKLLVKFAIQNPNSKDVVVRSLFGEVAINGRKVGRVQLQKPMTIKANDTSTLELAVAIKLINTITTVAQLTQGVVGSKILFTGTVNADNVATPLNIEYEIS